MENFDPYSPLPISCMDFSIPSAASIMIGNTNTCSSWVPHTINNHNSAKLPAAQLYTPTSTRRISTPHPFWVLHGPLMGPVARGPKSLATQDPSWPHGNRNQDRQPICHLASHALPHSKPQITTCLRIFIIGFRIACLVGIPVSTCSGYALLQQDEYNYQ